MTAAHRKLWTQGAKLTFYVVASFAVAVFVAVRYEVAIQRVNWSLVTIMMMGAVGAYFFYRWAKDDTNTFDPLDMILDPITRRVSPWRVFVTVLFGAGVWMVVTWALKDKPAGDIINLFTILMTAFVGKLVSSDWSDAIAKREPSVAEEPKKG